ncbi:MAG: PQQ-dependent sugar dehydrogenase [Myxococcota bacterium]
MRWWWLVSGCGPRAVEVEEPSAPPDARPTVGDPSVGAPVETDPANGVGQASARPGQTRAPSVRTAIPITVTEVAGGLNHPWWSGNLFVGALAGQHLDRLVLEGARVVGQELLADRGQGIRDVRQGPDGALWGLTDEDAGELLRLTPGRGR